MTTEFPYQVMPPLTPEELQQLEDSIAELGILVPVEMTLEGDILDGHHRVAIAKSLGITDYPVIVRKGLLSEESRIDHAFRLNCARRSLTTEQKRELLAGLLLKKESAGYSDRRIASIIGVSHPTVAAVKKELRSTGKIFQQTTYLTGKDGKKRKRKEHNEEPSSAISFVSKIESSSFNLILTAPTDEFGKDHKTLSHQFVRVLRQDGLLILIAKDKEIQTAYEGIVALSANPFRRSLHYIDSLSLFLIQTIIWNGKKDGIHYIFIFSKGTTAATIKGKSNAVWDEPATLSSVISSIISKFSITGEPALLDTERGHVF
jgi:hypothetical protein